MQGSQCVEPPAAGLGAWSAPAFSGWAEALASLSSGSVYANAAVLREACLLSRLAFLGQQLLRELRVNEAG